MRYAYYLRDADQAKQIYLSEDIYMSEKAEFHDSIEFIFVLEGEISANIDEESQTLSEGMICFVNSYQNHFYKPLTERTNAYVLVLSREYMREFHDLYGDMSFDTFMTDTHKNRDLFAIIRTWIGIGNRTYLKNFAYTNLLFAAIIDKYGLRRQKHAPIDAAEKSILLYVHEHYLEPLTLQGMAKKIGYSPDYLARVFKKKLNSDFKTYINVLRFRKVNELLSDATLHYSVQEAAEKSGFGSMATFYRARKKLEEQGLI